jgi:hypothetical protein
LILCIFFTLSAQSATINMSRSSSPACIGYGTLWIETKPEYLTKGKLIRHLRKLDRYMGGYEPSSVTDAFEFPRGADSMTEFPGFKALIALVREDALGDLAENLFSMLREVQDNYYPEEKRIGEMQIELMVQQKWQRLRQADKTGRCEAVN